MTCAAWRSLEMRQEYAPSKLEQLTTGNLSTVKLCKDV